MYTETTLIDIKKLSEDLLHPSISLEFAEQIVNNIYSYFKEITQVSGYDSDIKRLITLPAKNGMALSINHAAQCFLDYQRTTKFLRGTVQAIKDKLEENPNKKVHVFYAGCGPYAPFVTLVAPLFSPDEVEFSLLEINKDSLEQAEVLIENLGFTNYIKNCYLKDATEFKIPNPDEVDILFSETLDALLYRECYVPIMWNLIPQLNKDVKVIPENVKINVSFKEKENETFEATVFDVRKNIEKQHEKSTLPKQFESFKVDLSKADKYDRIVIDTCVEVYKEHVLRKNESSLTLSLEMEIEKPVIHKSVLFTYHTDPQMELKFTLEK
jgi:predicted RNA methylase